jgi:hypothetical protein
VGASFVRIEDLADGREQFTQTLDFLLLWVLDVAEEFFDTFVHNALSQHL